MRAMEQLPILGSSFPSHAPHMSSPSILLFLSALALAGTAHAADPAVLHGAVGCRIAALEPAPLDNDVSWDGACKNGFAEGKGTITWRARGDTRWKLEGNLVRGEIAGEATRSAGGTTYIGGFRNGVPHGAGYFKYPSGTQYEGGVVDGHPEGPGLAVQPDGSRYEGFWKRGRRDGYGKAVFALGGSYEGEWKDDHFHGKGRIVYAGSGRVYEGEFVGGRRSGSAPLVVEKGQFALKADRPVVGTNILDTRAVGFLPLDATWNTLTESQRDLIRSYYPALEDGDEPPYPLHGTRNLFKQISKVYSHFTDFQGTALLLVTVGANGMPATVKSIGVPNAELGRYLALVAMDQRFKPALCRGQPCEMIYPLKFEFSVTR